MHRLIYAIVEADTRERAISKGKNVFEELIESDENLFDYYVTFDRENTKSAGKGRWGDLPTAATVDSQEGKRLIERGWSATTDLENSPFAEHDSLDGAVLYDGEGNEIKHRDQLDQLLDLENGWIIPADAHL